LRPLLVQRKRKEATQTESLRGSCLFSGYSYTFVILSIRLLGCLSNTQFTTSSGKVL